MSLTFVTNRAAATANRQLGRVTQEVADSARKLASGSRVESAKDDAAAMAVGGRLRSELTALRQVQLNASQASSMLQIAEGAVSRVSDTLVRLKSLATQAGSGNLSNIERGLLDVEYQALISEIDRLAADTKFNGNALINSQQTVTEAAALLAAGIYEVSATGITPTGGPPAYTFDFNEATDTFTVTDGTTTWSGAIDTSIISAGAVITGGTVKLTAAGTDSYFTVSFNGPAASGTIPAFDATAAFADAANNVSIAGTGTTDLNFKIGTGSNPSEDQISISLLGSNTDALGLSGSNISTISMADAANAAIELAIDKVITARSQIGSTQNRVEATAMNIAITVENIDSARSAYLDLNVAEEISNFTAKQVLQQAGVSVAAQANQLPQNLLRLFQ